MAKRVATKRWLVAVNVLIIVGLVGSTSYLYVENKDLKEQSTLTTEQKNARLIEEINEVFDLPDETPVVAIVSDVDQFAQEYPTFDNAQNGDYLLFFRKARLNVLYRQSEKRVLQTANVAVPIAVELVGEEADIDAAATKLAEFGNQVTITRTVKSGVTQSFVFDVDGDQTAEVQSIADQLGLDLGSTLPVGVEAGAQTEVLVVVSKTSIDADSGDDTTDSSVSLEAEETPATVQP